VNIHQSLAFTINEKHQRNPRSLIEQSGHGLHKVALKTNQMYDSSQESSGAG
jgi:hypothetical protein